MSTNPSTQQLQSLINATQSLGQPQQQSSITQPIAQPPSTPSMDPYVQDILQKERDGQLSEDQMQSLARARENGTFHYDPLQKDENGLQEDADIAQKIGSSGLMGFGNQIGAGIASGANYVANALEGHPESLQDLKKNYVANRDWGIRQEKAFDKQHPVESFGASVVGGLAPLAIEGPVGAALESKTAGTALQSVTPYINAAGTGAAEGATYGAAKDIGNADIKGQSPNVEGNLTSDALLGAVGGLGGQLVGKLMASPIQHSVGFAKNVLSATPGFKEFISPEEQQSLAAGFLASKIGANKDDILEKLNNVPEETPYALVHAMGPKGAKLVRDIRAAYPDVGAEIDNTINATAQETPARLNGYIAEHLGNGENRSADQIANELNLERQAATKQLYKDAYGNMDFSPQHPVLQDALTNPNYSQFIEKGRARDADLANHNALMGRENPIENQYVADLHNVIKGLGDQIKKEKAAKDLTDAAADTTKRQDISDVLSQELPEFSNAQQEYAKYSKALDMLNDGSRLLTQNPNDVKQLLANPVMQNAARLKAASDIQEMLGAKGTTGSVMNNPQFNSGYAKQNLMQIAKDPENFIKKLQAEKDIQDTAKTIIGGSQTTDKQEGIKNLLGKAGSAIKTPFSFAGNILEGVGNPSENTLQEASQKLLSPDRETAIQALNQAQKAQARRRAYSNILSQIAKNKIAQQAG